MEFTDKMIYDSTEVIADDYTNNDIANTYTRGNTLIRHLKHCSGDANVKLYNSYCCNIYSSPLVSVCHKTVLDKFPVTCNKVFKSLLEFPEILVFLSCLLA